MGSQSGRPSTLIDQDQNARLGHQGNITMTRNALKQELRAFESGSAGDGNSQKLLLEQTERLLEPELRAFVDRHAETLRLHGDLLLEYSAVGDGRSRRIGHALAVKISDFPRVVQLILLRYRTASARRIYSVFKFSNAWSSRNPQEPFTRSWLSASPDARAFLLLLLGGQQVSHLAQQLLHLLSERFWSQLMFPQQWYHVALWADMLRDVGLFPKVLALLSFIDRTSEYDAIFLQPASLSPLRESQRNAALSLFTHFIFLPDSREDERQQQEDVQSQAIRLLYKLLGVKMSDGVAHLVHSPANADRQALRLLFEVLGTKLTGELAEMSMHFVQALVLYLQEHKETLSPVQEEHIYCMLDSVFQSCHDFKIRAFFVDGSVRVCSFIQRILGYNLPQVWPLAADLSLRTGRFYWLSHLFETVLLASARAAESGSLLEHRLPMLRHWCRRCSDFFAFMGISKAPKMLGLLELENAQGEFSLFARAVIELPPMCGTVVHVATLLSFVLRRAHQVKRALDAAEAFEEDDVETEAELPRPDKLWQQELEAHRKDLFAPVSLLLVPYLCSDVRAMVRDYLLDPALPGQLAFDLPL
ncbi:MAG: hypothetical protein MHM6MM_003204 [Cercozoa sp. M6MM]